MRRNFQVYRCKSGIAIFEWRVNKKYAYSPFSGPNKYKKHHLRFQQNFLVLNFGNFLNPTLLLWFLLFNWVFLWNYFFKNEDNSSLQLKGTNLFMKNIECFAMSNPSEGELTEERSGFEKSRRIRFRIREISRGSSTIQGVSINLGIEWLQGVPINMRNDWLQSVPINMGNEWLQGVH